MKKTQLMREIIGEINLLVPKKKKLLKALLEGSKHFITNAWN
jgi:uncharacterized protein (UPF0216 family)